MKHLDCVPLLVFGFSLLHSVAIGQGNHCANPTDLGSDEYVEFVFDGSTATTSGFDGMGACGAAGAGITHDLFWSYTAPRTTTYVVDVYGNQNIDRKVSVHGGTNCLASCLASEGNFGFFAHTTLQVDLSAGQQILIQVGGIGASLDTQILSVTAQADTCFDAVDIGSSTFSELVFSTGSPTASGFGSGTSCAFPNPTRDLFYRYTAPSSQGSYAFEVFGSANYTPDLRLYQGNDCSAPCLDVFALPGRAFVSLQAGDEVLIQVGDLGSVAEQGLFLVTAGLSDNCDGLTPDALEGQFGNNDCAVATLLSEGTYTDLNVGAFDPDFYRVELMAWETLIVRETQDSDGTEWTLLDATCSTEWMQSNALLQYTAGASPESVILRVERPYQLSCSEYAFELSKGVSIGETFCQPPQANCSGLPAGIAGSLIPGQGAGVHLTASSGPNNALGYFLVSSELATPGVAISNGTLCLGGSGAQIFRYNIAGDERNSLGAFSADGSEFVNAAGTGLGSPESGFVVPNLLPALQDPMITPGSTWHFQLWFRDDCFGALGSNFSNGVSVTF